MHKSIQLTEEYISGFFLCVTVAVVICNVLLRKLFGYSLYWAEEVSTTCFIWSVFVGASAAYKNHMHIGIDVLVRALPTVLERTVNLAVHVFMLILTSYLAWMCLSFMQNSSTKTTPVLEISYVWVVSGILIGFVLMAVMALVFSYQAFIDLVKPTDTQGEKGA